MGHMTLKSDAWNDFVNSRIGKKAGIKQLKEDLHVKSCWKPRLARQPYKFSTKFSDLKSFPLPEYIT